MYNSVYYGFFSILGQMFFSVKFILLLWVEVSLEREDWCANLLIALYTYYDTFPKNYLHQSARFEDILCRRMADNRWISVQLLNIQHEIKTNICGKIKINNCGGN